MAIKQYQYYIFSWSIKIWAPIFMCQKAVTDLQNNLYSPLVTDLEVFTEILKGIYFASTTDEDVKQLLFAKWLQNFVRRILSIVNSSFVYPSSLHWRTNNQLRPCSTCYPFLIVYQHQAIVESWAKLLTTFMK